MNTYGTNNVVTTGHSLGIAIFVRHRCRSTTDVRCLTGAAISLLDALYIPLHIPSANVKFVGYGLPRVGNQAFADYVDANFSGIFTRINHAEDPIPTVPGRFLGYVHASGEDHIEDNGTWYACQGE